MTTGYISGQVTQVTMSGFTEENEVIIRREGNPTVTITGLTNDEIKLFGKLYEQHINIALPSEPV